MQQNPKSDIIAHGGAEIASYLSVTSAERYELIREMMSFVDSKNITEIKDLIDYAMSERFDDWFRFFVIIQLILSGNI
ncbi:Rep family protein [Enterococcus faecium]|nr:Rep family protein [Enterococcus faecium]MDE3978842.1 Rep family protein [Enterococcus faecium]